MSKLVIEAHNFMMWVDSELEPLEDTLESLSAEVALRYRKLKRLLVHAELRFYRRRNR